MAKVLYGGGVANMSGSEAGTVHSHNKGGSYTRARTVPTNPQTARQMQTRDILSNFSKQWVNDLDQGQRDAWSVFATEHPVIDTLGQSIFLSGFQTYLKLNNRIATAGGTLINEPPLDLIVTQLTTADPTFDVGIGNVEMTFTPSPLEAAERLQIFCTPGISPGITYVKNKLRLIFSAFVATTSPFDFEAAWQAVFGALPPLGAKIVTMTRVIEETKGAISVPLRGETLVVST